MNVVKCQNKVSLSGELSVQDRFSPFHIEMNFIMSYRDSYVWGCFKDCTCRQKVKIVIFFPLLFLDLVIVDSEFSKSELSYSKCFLVLNTL